MSNERHMKMAENAEIAQEINHTVFNEKSQYLMQKQYRFFK